jgi:hypothetical protein
MFLAVRRASCPIFMFCTPDHLFSGAEGVGSYFHVLHVGTHFRRNRGRRLPFSCFFIFGIILGGTKGVEPVFMVCDPGHIFDGTEGVVSQFLVLRSHTHFRRYRGRRFPFLCFARSDSLSEVPRYLGPVFIFCAPELIFSGTEGVGSRFHILCSRTRFRRSRGR